MSTKVTQKNSKKERENGSHVMPISLLFWCGAQDIKGDIFPRWKDRISRLHDYGKELVFFINQQLWFVSRKTSAAALVLPLSICLRRTPSQNHLRKHQLKQEVIEKMRQELKRPRSLPWPPKSASLKGNDHHSLALRWSLLILIMELRKNGLEVGESIY